MFALVIAGVGVVLAAVLCTGAYARARAGAEAEREIREAFHGGQPLEYGGPIVADEAESQS